jgi:N12 class adenine-specific DNA methylase
VDLETIASLLDTDAKSARRELGQLVWDDLATGELLPAQRYLSGDVRARLAEAEAAAAADARWQGNVKALRAGKASSLGLVQRRPVGGMLTIRMAGVHALRSDDAV